jgi:hypothetical protein
MVLGTESEKGKCRESLEDDDWLSVMQLNQPAVARLA